MADRENIPQHEERKIIRFYRKNVALSVSEYHDGEYYGAGLQLTEQEECAMIGHNGAGIGHGTSMWADVDCDIGIVIMVNGAVPYISSSFPLQILRAARRNRPLPPPESVVDPTIVDNADQYAGSYSCREKRFELVAENQNLIMTYGGARIALECREGNDRFYVNHPDFELFFLEFGRNKNGTISEAFYGSDEFIREGYLEPSHIEYPKQWDAYIGHYRSYTPWLSNFRIILRKGELFLTQVWGWGYWEYKLSPLENGYFSIGEGPTEKIRFDTIIDNRALRALKTSGEYYRYTLD